MKLFANLRVSQKLLLAFGVLLAVIAATFATVYVQVDKIESRRQAAARMQTVADHVADLQETAEDQLNHIRGLLISGDRANVSAYEQASARFEAGLAPTMQLLDADPAMRTQVEQMAAIVQDWHATAASVQIERTLHPMQVNEARAIEAVGAGENYLSALGAASLGIRKDIEARRQQLSASMENAVHTAIVTVVVGAIVSILVAVASVLVLIQAIASPIRQITTTMGTLADGETAVEVPFADRKDEIGAMAGAVGVFKVNAIERVRLEGEQAVEREVKERRAAQVQALASTFGQAAEGALAAVTGAATELEGTARSMSSIAEETTRQSHRRSRPPATCRRSPPRRKRWRRLWARSPVRSRVPPRWSRMPSARRIRPTPRSVR